MNPDELRSRLALAYPDEAPPPDLAARAERAAGRLRRRRAVAVAVAAAIAVAVPLSVAAVARPDRALPPAGGPVDRACTWDQKVLPRQGIAGTDAEVAAWGSRGDPALRARAQRIARSHSRVDTVQVLYADAELVVYAARLLPDLRDHLLVAIRIDQDGKVLGGAGARPAYPGPNAVISLLVPWRRIPAPPPGFVYGSGYSENMLVVLAPPGSTGMTFRGCRDGEPFTVRADGDTLVRNVGTLDAPGTLAVHTASGSVGYQGPVADLPFGTQRAPVRLPAVEPVPVPAGLRQVARQVGQGIPLEDPEAVTADRASVLIRCRAADVDGPIEVYAGTALLGAARCDGSVELVAGNVPVDGVIRLGRDAGRPPAVSYQLLVVSD